MTEKWYLYWNVWICIGIYICIKVCVVYIVSMCTYMELISVCKMHSTQNDMHKTMCKIYCIVLKMPHIKLCVKYIAKYA